MKTSPKTTLLGGLLLVLFAIPARAQSIVAAPDGIETRVQQQGNTYTITGGTQSGANLFHSFSELGLSPNEIANFLSNPNIENILGRVTGGNPSIIQGLLTMTGGNSNLLLMNPAGIVFTSGASLNLPASFTATTADSIGFLNGGRFKATGNVDFTNLTDAPTNFNFGSLSNGSIINAARLSLNSGNLALIGSHVINTGTLSSSDGNITVTAVPHRRSLRINQAGMMLGIEIVPPDSNSNVTAADIPRLLNNPALQSATGLEVSQKGEIRLTGSSHNIDAAGNVTLAGSVSGQQVYLGAANDVNPIGNPESLIRTHNNQDSAPTIARFPVEVNAPNRYIFLDATVPQYQDLLFGGERGTTTVAVARSEDGIAKISEVLNTPGLSKVDELHILSEGDVGNFWLGNAFVSRENIGQYQQQIQSWSKGLNVGAEILLYACLAAAGVEGETLLGSLANYTGAKVAGSTNRTGAGGDWVLERRIGNGNATVPIEAGVLANYRESLALFTVQNGADGGTDSLRWAIGRANGAAGDDEIRFASGVKWVTLTSAQLDIDTTTGGLKIVGDANSPGNVTVERGTGAGNFRIFNITGNNNVTMEALTVSKGIVVGNGGGINNNGTGTLTLNRSTVVGNRASQDGGGIFSNGTLSVNGSNISNNGAGVNGGGAAVTGAISVSSSNVTGNSNAGGYGGGLYSTGTISFSNSLARDNAASLNGGATASQNLTANSSIFDSNATNRHGGAIHVVGNASLTNSTVDSNIALWGGGGIYSNTSTSLTNSTVSHNQSNFDSGGGINSPNLTVTNSTISGNQTRASGGGINNRGGTTTITNSTITNNIADSDRFLGGAGGGIFNAAGTISLRNSIVAGNQALSSNTHDVSGSAPIDGDANNIIGYNTASGTVGTGSDQTFATLGIGDTSTLFAPLANNGGPTRTHLLLPNSPALNGGNNAHATVSTDQRGAPRIANSTVDIGAVEFGYRAIASNTSQTATINTSFSNPLNVQIVETLSNQPLAGVAVTFAPAPMPAPETSSLPTPPPTHSPVARLFSALDTFEASSGSYANLEQIQALDLELTSEFEAYFKASDVSEGTGNSDNNSAGSSSQGSNGAIVADGMVAAGGTATADGTATTSDNADEDRENSAQGSPQRSSLEQARAYMREVERVTFVKPAIVYAVFVPDEETRAAESPMQSAQARQQATRAVTAREGHPSDRLKVMFITGSGLPVTRQLEVTREEVIRVANEFRTTVTNRYRPKAYLAPSQQLYQWLMAPIESELRAQQVRNLLFIVDRGLRSIPLAALHDGERFIIERFSVGLLPSLGFSDLRYANLKNSSVLAMGASTFADRSPLPAVPTELELVGRELWKGDTYLNKQFTLEQLQAARAASPYSIIHFATHSEFQPGSPSNSYIQLWDRKLALDELRNLQWHEPPVELLVLSACRTALGDEDAELGFAGLAALAGVKTALGSLWYVSDEGTLGLMATFYEEMKQAPIKAEALRRAQLAMLHGAIAIRGGQLVTPSNEFPLPSELQGGERDFTHPFYWSAFVAIGSPF